MSESHVERLEYLLRLYREMYERIGHEDALSDGFRDGYTSAMNYIIRDLETEVRLAKGAKP